MSALMNHNNEIPVPLIRWKQNVFYTIGSKKQSTKDTNENTTGHILFKARPLKRIYRREKFVNITNEGNARLSVTIDLANAPGGSSLYTDASAHPVLQCEGVLQTANVKDVEPNNNQSDLGKDCAICNDLSQIISSSTSAQNSVFSPQMNARRRVRSAGMIAKQYQDPRYFTDSNQYMVSRNRTIHQNNFHYIRKGDPSLMPGTPLSKTNIYSPQGLSHCKNILINSASDNNEISYIWLDETTYTVTIPDGYYDIFSFNHAIQQEMYTLGHYYTNVQTGTPNYLITFSYNTLYGVVELQVLPASLFPSPAYTGFDASGSVLIPQVVIPASQITVALGLTSGDYPSSSALDTPQIFYSDSSAGLKPPYVPIYYKPSNPQFANQGGVSSSNYVSKRRYDAITNNGEANRQAYGAAVANALAYSVPIPGYTLKDKIGYPNKLIPKFPLTQPDVLLKCQPTRFSNL